MGQFMRDHPRWNLMSRAEPFFGGPKEAFWLIINRNNLKKNPRALDKIKEKLIFFSDFDWLLKAQELQKFATFLGQNKEFWLFIITEYFKIC